MKRAPGRPPLDDDDTTSKACVRLPTRQYDRALNQARQNRETFSDLLRRGLKQVMTPYSAPFDRSVRRK